MRKYNLVVNGIECKYWYGKTFPLSMIQELFIQVPGFPIKKCNVSYEYKARSKKAIYRAFVEKEFKLNAKTL